MIVAITAVMAIYSLFIFISSYAGVIYPAGSMLQPNDVTSSHIRNHTIVDVDISSSSAITYGKLNLAQGLIDNDVATSTRISTQKIATSTSFLFVQDSAQTWAGVKTFSSIPATTGGNCAAGNDLCNKTYTDTKSSFPTSTTAFLKYDGLYTGTSSLGFTGNTAMFTGRYILTSQVVFQECGR